MKIYQRLSTHRSSPIAGVLLTLKTSAIAIVFVIDLITRANQNVVMRERYRVPLFDTTLKPTKAVYPVNCSVEGEEQVVMS